MTKYVKCANPHAAPQTKPSYTIGKMHRLHTQINDALDECIRSCRNRSHDTAICAGCLWRTDTDVCSLIRGAADKNGVLSRAESRKLEDAFFLQMPMEMFLRICRCMGDRQ